MYDLTKDQLRSLTRDEVDQVAGSDTLAQTIDDVVPTVTITTQPTGPTPTITTIPPTYTQKIP